MAVVKDGKLINRDDVLLCADFKEGCVYTNCADDYYNYSISFDDFIKFAEFIKREQQDGTKAIYGRQ